MSQAIIGLDLGGTRIRAARFDEQLTLLAREETPTQAQEGFDAVLHRMTTLLHAVMPPDDTDVLGIGISAPGPLNPATGVIIDSENLPGWQNIPLVQLMRDAFGLPVYLGNDANVAALAETLRGAARGYRDVVYLTLSTGIGGGIMTDGRLLNGSAGMAAEVGFMLIVRDRLPHNLQDLAAGPAIAQQGRAAVAAGESALMRELAGGDVDRIDSAIVGQAAAGGDPVARRIIDEASRLIGMGAANLVHLFNPQIIVIGGGVSQIGEPLFAPIRAAVREFCIPPYWEHLQIVPAAFGENVGLVGAAALVVTAGGSDLDRPHSPSASGGS